MKPAFRGPARSSHPPQIAAEIPSMAMKVSKMWVTLGTVQLQLWDVSSVKNPWPAQLGAPGSSALMGSQNTLKPYAMPMQRWMARAAGGASHRLKSGPAMVRSRSKAPGPRDSLSVTVICAIWFAS